MSTAYTSEFTQEANKKLLEQVGRLNAGDHLVGDQACILCTTLGVDTQVLSDAPGGEMVWIYVYTDNPETFCLQSLAAYLGITQPFVECAMQFVTVLKRGEQPCVVFALEPGHADGLNLLAHESPLVVESDIVAQGGAA